ncbi:transcriptional regulator [Halocalculus aciditolerans]|uniref:Transcriptional regulator n=2 Tax=Halocalculus aciditolerans TaxID=1383812 RepID=A0A830FBE8_9EURY|nr:transcriptional regulator [Halocalculus aciditolerans]
MRDSAQFNYHLGRLTDQFVTKTADGYDFRYAGEKVVRAVLAGTFTDRREFSLAAPGRCHDCGGDLVASYDDERFTIACADCAATFGRDPFPPGGLADRDPDEVLAAFDQHVRHRHCLAADGVCPECGGRTETELRDGDDALGTEYCVSHCCRQCNHCVHSPVGLSLLDNSRVVGFCGDHGVELTDHPYWTLAWCVRDDTTTVESRDPLRVTVGIPLGDERLDVTLDDDLRVLDTTRTSRGADAGGLAEPT